MRSVFLGGVATAAISLGAAAQTTPDSAALGAAGIAETEESASESQSAPPEIRLAQLDVITVYATRNPMPAFDYPGQASVIERDVIDDLNPSTVSDVFQAIPGARFDGGPRRAGETPTIRGLEGEGVLVLFDGARQSFLSGHDGRFFVDPDLLKAVEVVRGPASALYGSGALGGVVALRTVTAEDFLEEGQAAGVKAGAGFQSVNDEWRLSTSGAWRSADGRLDMVGGFTYRKSGDIALGSGLDLPADDQVASSLLKATARPADAWTVSASWIRYRGDSVDPNNPQGENIAGPGNELVDREIESDTVQGVVNFAPGSALIDLNLTAYHTRNDVTEDERESTRVVSRIVETTGVALDNRSRFDFGRRATLTLTYGGEFYVDEQTGRDNTSPDGTRGGVPNAKSRFYGAFAQGELALERPLGAPGVLTLIPGVRWDRFENEAPDQQNTEDSAVSPKIGVSYKPLPQLILFGNWAEAFRAPSFNEIYADGVHFQIPDMSAIPPFPPTFVTNFFIANPDLVAEESETWEVGAGVDFNDILSRGDSFTAKASYYESDVTNLIDLEVSIPAGCFGAPFPPCGSGEAFGNFSRNVNVTNAKLSGVELEAQYDSEWVYARANYATIDGENVDTGDFVGVLSPDRFFIDGGVKLRPLDMRLGARVTIAGDFEKANDPSLFRDDYATGDVYLVWEPSRGALRGLRVDLGVDNVTDADYEVIAAGVSQPGRNVKIAARWRQGF
ncbi:TonB-dependent receptor domain-containing protein [Amphiplicatus metriothermophilus]|uniref:Hemoglobin/transferrin/lactoferrin receptor protein n=1 Tax=Amphiplicatus metriothermophilus TaxID=1519374 RepID=A0A239PZI0_9PROT|nr:TonB-dependent receptor [Amphiplicatus metriothermophilus]MBB5518261.1 hemoglobin/transferrin/lactoferrin receptor protein [Amphiplicatus metriothermophilus]SNT75488.1 hemoglobin/transferrin/lactoferrin receptor protein [Amphiplicatus metriothermophilus]